MGGRQCGVVKVCISFVAMLEAAVRAQSDSCSCFRDIWF